MKRIVTAAVMLALSAPAMAREVTLESALFYFEYAWPAVVDGHPVLRRRLDADLARQLAKLKAEARAGQAEARANALEYHPYSWNQTWQVVTDLPAWLSLSASYWSFSGGAHGNTWFGAMLFDKRANTPRDPLTLFTSKAALSQAIRAPFCAALNRQRTEKRGEAIKPGSTAIFEECIDPVGQTILLGSKSRRAFDRIGILVAPYQAGPYAEGTYEVTVPVTPAVLAAIKPRFRNAFAASR